MAHLHKWECSNTDDSGRGHKRTMVIEHKCVGCPAIMLTTLLFTDAQVSVLGVTITEARADRDDRFERDPLRRMA